MVINPLGNTGTKRRKVIIKIIIKLQLPTMTIIKLITPTNKLYNPVITKRRRISQVKEITSRTIIMPPNLQLISKKT